LWRGFDSFYGYFAGSQDYYNKQSLCWAGQFVNGCFENTTASGEAVTGLDFHDGQQTVRNNTEYSTITYTEQAIRLIQDHRASGEKRPMFLYLPHQAVHVGNVPTKSHPEYALDQAPQMYIDEYKWVKDEKRRNLSAMVTVMDESAGNVTKALKAAEMWDNTIFIFRSLKGPPLDLYHF
jgi:arylsulfatase A-like enzyme